MSEEEQRVFLTGCALVGILLQSRDRMEVVAEDAIAQADETIRQLKGQGASEQPLRPKSRPRFVK